MQLIGEILQQHCGLSREALDTAFEQQKAGGGRIGEILLAQNAITEKDLLSALSIQFGLPLVLKLPVQDQNTSFTAKVPIHFLKSYKMVPVSLENGGRIAVHDPLLFQPLDDLRLLLDIPEAEIVLSPRAAILSTINTAYDMTRASAEQVMQDMPEADGEKVLSEIRETGDLLDDTSDAPIIKLVNVILSQAVRSRASDIHIEPYRQQLKVRYRVDGILYDMLAPPKHIQAALLSRIKIMARLNIAEKRLPQDGRIEIQIGDKNIDVRVATLPTAFGERIVLRLLDKSRALMKLPELGMSSAQLAGFERLIQLPHGIILVTGPTGSGKTTTLYAALSMLNNPEINIITIEDPIEYRIEGIGQIQVNPKINLTFAKGLRSIVRQDPDAILVGEIRDRETAEIAIHSALTGHLVFSTLHTNDSAGAVTRLIDMRIEPFLVNSAVIGILAQRLVRLVCPQCKEEYVPDETTLAQAGIPAEPLGAGKIYRGKGCSNCLHTGYRGRTGIFELMQINDPLKDLISRTAEAGAIKQQALAHGMQTLRQDGIRKALEGVTSFEEVLRVTQA